MDRHLLITFSEQKSALHGVRFAGHFFSDKASIKSTFFYSCPKPPETWDEKKGLEAVQYKLEQERKLLNKGKAALESAIKEGIHLGFPRENLFQKLQNRVFTKVADIIEEGEKGSYDAVVLGRRGISMLESAFDESVSKSLFQENLTFPLWLCRSSDPKRTHVLFHADGSQTSFNMADHVGFMLCVENRHRVDILPTDTVASDPAAQARYVDMFKDYGLEPERVTWLTPPKGDLAGAILELAERNAYAAVALGRTNPNASMLTRLFKGPVCSRLFKDLVGAALWICH